jgi:hypothetical protein
MVILGKRHQHLGDYQAARIKAEDALALAHGPLDCWPTWERSSALWRYIPWLPKIPLLVTELDK